MRALVLLLVCSYITSVICSDRCTYSYCAKEELDQCESSDSRTRCNERGGLYVTYREGIIYPSKHKCCLHKFNSINQLPDKYLHCVRNIRTKDMKCSTETSDEYTLKLRTKCNKMTCIKID